ncbi:MAG: DNA polymerase I [Pseudomonadota bacterium]|nr:DNA polymerase I [Pseudomonadota bacterium]
MEKLEKNNTPHLVIIDGFSFLFRAYHAVRMLNKTDGTPTNALYGFSQMMIKVLTDLKPDLCAVALDSPVKNFRYDIYPDYKANRSEMDDDMKAQMPFFEPLIAGFGVPALRVDGYEADDIIATLAKDYGDSHKVTIVSSDKDLMQLVTNNVSMLDTMKNKSMSFEEVMDKFGVTPDKVIEVQALIGDSSDNVPGVPSVGPKTAAQLIGEYGSLETLYANLDDIKKPKLLENLTNNKDKAFMSRELVSLKSDVPLSVTGEDLDFHPDCSEAADILTELEFFSLAKKVKAEGEKHRNGDTSADAVVEEESEKKSYQTVDTLPALKAWMDKIKAKGFVAFDTETTSLHVQEAQLVGFSLSVEAGEACYVPLNHKVDLLSQTPQLTESEALPFLKEILEDPEIKVIGQNIKYDMHIMHKYDVHVNNVQDTMLMSFALNAGNHAHNMDDLSQRYLGITPIPYKSVAGTGQKQVTFDHVDIVSATAYAAEDADITLQLYLIFEEMLNQDQNAGVKKIYEELELPLLEVLRSMERKGVEVDAKVLQEMTTVFSAKLEELEKSIYGETGSEFNLNSPKQLSKVLFEDMALTLKGKTPKSTNVTVLEALADEGHDIAAQVLNYRKLAKLKSTYTEALQEQIAADGRVHTSYNPVGASTGRLSSTDPNLQNIPIRTEEGRKIRTAFVPRTGYKMVSLDYSQIELRLLADMSGAEGLLEAFNGGQDIHAFTAHQIFGTPLDEVTSEQRSIAKSINFGIVYGMGAHSLARQVGVSNKEAAQYIQNYFERYSGIKDYIEGQQEFARENGYVETLMGRRLWLPNINASNGMLKSGAERVAINAPLQGGNADLIKKAMIQIHAKYLGSIDVRMLLQVHDELIFEIKEDVLEVEVANIEKIMENIIPLKVPLKVGVGIGNNWDEAH